VTASHQHTYSPPRPSLADLGATRFAVASFAWQAVLGLLTAVAFWRGGIAIDWPSVALRLALLGVLVVVWRYYARWPGRSTEWWIPNLLFAEIILATFAVVALPAQYAAVSAGRPLVDTSLARADAALGIHVPTLVAWVAQHPIARYVIIGGYGCFVPEILVLPIVLAILRDRRGLWSFVFQYQLWSSAALAGIAVWPAAIAFAYFGISPIVGREVMAAQVLALHSGTFAKFSFDAVEGLVSLPSFHTSLALLAVWSFRRHRALCLGLAVPNAIMIVGAAVLGLHYVVDVIASLLLFPIGIGIEAAVFKPDAPGSFTTPEG
jgi:hypothetical protein